ncbi:HD family phosphohydrolase [Bacillus timonensis]|nr:HD family phosphohydrolase [Bacillus timonensis]
MGNKYKLLIMKISSFLKGFRFLHILVYVLLIGVMYASMYSNIKPEKLDIELLDISNQTIRSPITKEDIDLTKKRQEEARQAVEDVYSLRTEYAKNRVDLVISIFDSVSEVNQELEQEYEQKQQESSGTYNTEGETTDSSVQGPTTEEKLNRLKQKLPTEIISELPDSLLTNLLNASPDQLLRAKDATVTAVHNIMKTRISDEELQQAKNKVEEELKLSSVNSSLKSAVVELAKYSIIPNVYLDFVQTEEKRQQAAESVETVKILAGQIIVEEGYIVSKEVYRQLKLVGLLESDNSVKPYIGISFLIVLLISIIIYYFNSLIPKNRQRNMYILLYGIIFSITIVLMKTISLFQQIEYSEIGFIVPVAMGPLLVKLLINERIAIMTSVIFAICGSIIYNEGITGSFNFSVGIYYMFAGIAGVLFLSQHNRRAKILQAGLFVSVVNVIFLLSVLLLKNAQFTDLETGSYIVMAVVSGVVGSVLTIGLLPFFEAGFGILSTMKLIELSNPNHPLLRKILTETPGTYHHSVMVANLAEAACESIGADGLLARVGCYYHDIGKTKRPHFFIENQLNIDNPHDKISPQLSKNIIVAHATDGADYLRKHKLPQEIVDIAEQHHGTTLLKYFFHKAKQQGETDISEDDFRYPGPKAQSKEAAIVGIADSVEAAVRSLTNPNTEKIETLVKSIIAERLQDGQLNECDLTLKELEQVSVSLCETLKGIFHSRIEYPEITRQKVKEA